MSIKEEVLGKLGIMETKNLYPHEQVISHNLKRLKQAMLNIGQLVDPIVIDKETSVVLDGNHRLKVLDIIECPFAVCQLVDYNDPSITVGTWYPAIEKTPEEMGRLDHVKLEKVDEDEGKKAADELRAPFMLKYKEECYLINPGQYKIMEMVEEQNYVLSLLEKNKVEYIADQESELIIKEGKTVLFRRAYTKEEIKKAALNHTPFPPKSTRHNIPGRIIRLNMRLGWLHRSAEEAEREMKRNLSARLYEGNVRKYYEPVIVIY